MTNAGFLLVLTVAVIGVLHTAVPDHWAPITLMARSRGWSRAQTARAAATAGAGHVTTTLIIALAVWGAGAAFATRFGHYVDVTARLLLIGFGIWIAASAWREMRGGHGHGHGGLFGGHDHDDHHDHDEHDHDHHDHHDDDEDDEDDELYRPLGGVAVLGRHRHPHRHGGMVHEHRHDHAADTMHDITAEMAITPPLHEHRHKTPTRMALLLILGSSPMVEGIPAFFAASRLGIAVLALMALVFAVSTIATYVLLCVASLAGLQRISLGPLERYGEVISGVFIALVGIVFWLWPLA